MEKIRNLLNPGGKTDDETLYGSGHASLQNSSAVTGEGSHFPSSTGAQAPDASSTTALKDGVPGPHPSNLLNNADSRVDSDRDGSATVGGASTGGATGPPLPDRRSGRLTRLSNKHDANAAAAPTRPAPPAHTRLVWPTL